MNKHLVSWSIAALVATFSAAAQAQPSLASPQTPPSSTQNKTAKKAPTSNAAKTPAESAQGKETKNTEPARSNSSATPSSTVPQGQDSTQQPVTGTFVGDWWVNPKTRPNKGSSWGVGATAGFTSGIGIAARRHFDSGFGLHFGGMGMWTRELRHANFSTQLLYSFLRTRFFRAYGLAGVMWSVNERTRHETIPTTQRILTRYPSHNIAFGPGVGAELHLSDHFSFGVEIPFVVRFAGIGESTPPATDRFSMFPAINAGLFIYF